MDSQVGAPTIQTGVRGCPLCGRTTRNIFANNWKPEFPSGRSFRYEFCERCGLVFSDPTPSSEELAWYYSEQFQYQWYVQHAWLKKIQGIHRWWRTKRRLRAAVHFSNPSLLDVGCGHGWYLHSARKDGWDVCGADLPSPAFAFARDRLKLPMYETDAALDLQLARPFDVVSLWHTLEHLREPSAALRRLRSLIKPTGVLLIALPNLNAAGLKVRTTKWVWLQPPFVHIWHFSDRSLSQLLESNGFAITRIETRDTWDAQYLFDALVGPIVGRASSLVKRVARSVSAELAERFDFYITESLRIICYLPYIALRPIIQSLFPRKGSELLVFAKLAAMPKS